MCSLFIYVSNYSLGKKRGMKNIYDGSVLEKSEIVMKI